MDPVNSTPEGSGPGADSGDVVVFWRPGCGFCSRLLAQLDSIRLPLTLVNIWEDPAAAAIVRSVANGNETVPTVIVGGIEGAALVNPSRDEVVAAVAQHAPHLLSD